MDKTIFFKNELATIEADDIRAFAEYLRDNAPDYLYTIPASTSSKYHPVSELGIGGLYRHSMNVTRVLNHLLSIDQYKLKLTDRERDLMRVSMMFHDAVKVGWNGSLYTVQDHPLLAAEWVKKMNNEYDDSLLEEEIEFVAANIASHGGQWVTNKKGEQILPKPETLSQELCHLADYLGSRRDVEILHDEDEIMEPVFTKEERDNYKITFGKYKGVAFGDVVREDPDYIEWMYNSHFDEEAKFKVPEPLWTFAKEIIEWDGEAEDDIDDWEI